MKGDYIVKKIVESSMTNISIMKKQETGLENVLVESPMTMCEQNITIMKKQETGLENVLVESPMTMCEQNITIMKRQETGLENALLESPINKLDVLNESKDARKEYLQQFSTIKRMIS